MVVYFIMCLFGADMVQDLKWWYGFVGLSPILIYMFEGMIIVRKQVKTIKNQK